jgi:hypothetical protein
MLDVSPVLVILYRPFGSHHTPLAGFVNFLLFRRNKFNSNFPGRALSGHQAFRSCMYSSVQMSAIMIPPLKKKKKKEMK